MIFERGRTVSRANFIPADRYVHPQKTVPKKNRKWNFWNYRLFIKKKFYETLQDFTGWPVWAPKKCHLKKLKFLKLPCLFIKSLMKILKISLLIIGFTSIANVEKGSSVLTLLSTKQWNVLTPKSLDKLMIFETNCCNKLQLISLGISYRRITLGRDM